LRVESEGLRDGMIGTLNSKLSALHFLRTSNCLLHHRYL
jgi:hypothetical protein